MRTGPTRSRRAAGVATGGAGVAGTTAAAVDKGGLWLGWVACLPCRPSASRVLHKLRIPFGDGRKRPPLTPSLWRHGGWQVGRHGLPGQSATRTKGRQP
jgi:hypothetical protein